MLIEFWDLLWFYCYLLTSSCLLFRISVFSHHAAQLQPRIPGLPRILYTLNFLRWMAPQLTRRVVNVVNYKMLMYLIRECELLITLLWAFVTNVSIYLLLNDNSGQRERTDSLLEPDLLGAPSDRRPHKGRLHQNFALRRITAAHTRAVINNRLYS